MADYFYILSFLRVLRSDEKSPATVPGFLLAREGLKSPGHEPGFSFLEIGMKSKYRCLVEDILSCEQKLREAKSIQRDAQEKLTKADGYVTYQEASLRESERKLAEIEAILFGSETQALR
ncbi:hypothetical protein [Pseudomonas sp.]|uniref:hypothetical protein n=1 Tax=Pseudomonas sp. TaxID=306 RepID=UPI001B013118|nr:hypothetical protein [Pseudomonas sp.]MBO9552207.1 hypothetical protein [Pseudomonas sp.]